MVHGNWTVVLCSHLQVWQSLRGVAVTPRCGNHSLETKLRSRAPNLSKQLIKNEFDFDFAQNAQSNIVSLTLYFASSKFCRSNIIS